MQGLETPVLIGAIGALGGLLLLVVRFFLNGTVLSRTTVPREDYAAQVAIAASYAQSFGEQTKAVQSLISAVDRQSAIIEKLSGQLARSKNVPSRVRSDRES